MTHLTDAQVIASKLIIPRYTGPTLYRPRLCEEIDSQSLMPLNIICAPAGFGKSILAIHWIEKLGLPVAWYSIDGEDNDAVRWMRHLVAAFRTVDMDFGTSIIRKLNSVTPANVVSLIPGLLDLIADIPHKTVFVLDDYHLIENDLIHHIIKQIIALESENLYLLITSRSKLPRPFSNLLEDYQVYMVNGEDLRFSRREIDELLNNMSGLGLNENDIEILEKRTEGWVSGLQLAEISLQTEVDKSSFIKAFNGVDRYIMDYLSEEVLSRQSDNIKEFLLKTSVLDQFSGPLCDAVTGIENCSDYLDRLQHTNMFLFAVDSKRNWYRYHHLFSEFLRSQLQRTQPDACAKLYLKASDWYSDNDYPYDAMRYALEYAAAKDNEISAYEQAVKILDRYVSRLFIRGQSPVLINWFRNIPEVYINQSPNRMLIYIWIMFLGRGEVQAPQLEELESRLRKGQIEKELAKDIEGELSFLHAFHMMQGRNIDCSIDLAIHALTLTPQQLGPRMLVAGGLYAKGQLREAESRFSEVVRDAFEQQYTIVLSACITGLACTIMKQGRLNEAVNVIESNIDALHENGWYEMLHDRSCLYLALGEIAYKRNELIAAQKYFKKVKEETRIGPFEELERIADIYLAMIDWNQGDKTAAAKALEEYTNLVVLPAPLPLFQSYSLVLARAAMLMNNSKPAIDYIASRNISETYEPHPERESDDILLIRVLLKNRDTEKSLQLISSLMDNAEQEHRVEALLELWVLQVVALQQLGDQKRAVESLQHALKLAEVENCVRIFINEHVPVRKLLEYVVKNCNDTTYARKLLELMPGDDEDLEDNPEKRHSCATILSNTELRILCLLTMGLSNKEIAEKSFISNNTVKTHLRNIYQKLGVNNRAKAIVRAKELGIERRAGHAE